jgi:hypothetical protein
MQNRLAFLRFIGFALLAGLVIWIGVSVMYGVSREAPKLLEDGHAFEGNTQLRARILDDDVTSFSNLNRNMITLVEDVGAQKVDVIAARCGLSLRSNLFHSDLQLNLSRQFN